VIKWKHFADLEELQTAKGLHLANKITSKNIDFHPDIMKVKLATQLMSERAASSFDYLRGSEHKNFEDSAPTSYFCRVFNNIFDIFNSRSVKQKFLKSPPSKENQISFFSLMDEVAVNRYHEIGLALAYYQC
jgi:hypothetical protein